MAGGVRAGRAFVEVYADATKMQRQMRGLRGSWSKFSKGMGGDIAAMASGYLGVSAAIGAVKDGLVAIADEQRNLATFEVMLGDPRTAERLANAMGAMAKSTPFAKAALMDAARALAAVGFEADDIPKKLTVIGDIAAGSKQPIGELATILGRMSRGAVQMEEINQLVDRGINVWDGLAAKFGDVREASKNAEIGFDDLWKVLTDLREDKFMGAMAAQSETLAGAMSTLQDEILNVKKAMAETFTGDTVKLLRDMTYYLNQFSKGVDVVASLDFGFGKRPGDPLYGGIGRRFMRFRMGDWGANNAGGPRARMMQAEADRVIDEQFLNLQQGQRNRAADIVIERILERIAENTDSLRGGMKP